MDQSWKGVKLSKATSKCIKSLGFDRMTPVQAACIPHFLANKDVAVEAVTGSGKTLAFVIPIMEKLVHKVEKLKPKEVGAIIITPTRELAVQIHEVVEQFSKFHTLTCSLFIGGTNPVKDIESFKSNGAQVIVATPGRLHDLFTRKESGLVACVKSLEILILDEADMLLAMGFEKSINSILSYLPKQRRTGLFSATMSKEVESLVRAGLRNPCRIEVKEKSASSTNQHSTPNTLTLHYMICSSEDKFNQMMSLLKQHEKKKVMVFFSTCACVEYFSSLLTRLLKNTPVYCIHGKMKSKRNNIFDKFRQAEHGILTCTDVMARGVDIPDVHWVIQYDPPTSAESSFVHRCGRTARIGKTGDALLLLQPNEDAYIHLLNNKGLPMQQMELQSDVPDMLASVRQLAQQDRSIFDKGNRAFVSYIQGYRKHEYKLLFNLKELDFGNLATGFGLLRLPKMPELKGKDVSSFEATEMDTNSIPYLNKDKEKTRQQKLETFQETGMWPGKKKGFHKSKPWEKSKEKSKLKKEKKEQRKNAKKRKWAAMHGGADSDDDGAANDLDDIARDAKLLKRFKKGKITEKKFDKMFLNDDK